MKICKAFTAVPVLVLMLFVAMAQADDRAIKRRTDAADGPEKRYALIIGNGDYSVGRLKNPPADARLMAQTLEDLGFEVTVRTDLDHAGMNRVIDAFGDSLKNGTVGLFFFAGHGVQYKGRNYLVPVNANLNDGNELKYRAVDAGLVMAKMESAGNPVNIVVLDACRNNPFSRSWRSASRAASGRGLVQMDAPAGTKIIYATRPGDVAQDGNGNNSPFTESLAVHLKSADRELEQVIRQVYRDVYRETGGAQKPWAEGILVRDVYLARSSGYDESKPGDGRLTVKANVPGAEVWVNDRKYGKVPLTLKISARGEYRVRVTAEGYEDYTSRVVMNSDEDREVNALLKREDAGPVVVVEPREKDRFTNSLGMEFVYIPPGSFMMGSPANEPGRSDDEKQHRVTLTKGFYMGTTEVTQAQWQAVMGSNPSSFKNCGDDCPVEQVSWEDVQEFIQKLNRLEGEEYRLPTEAEWEYAARAGAETALYSGPIEIKGKNNAPALDPIAWYAGNSCVSYANGYDCSSWPEKQKTCSTCGPNPVGRKIPNDWGLYDMIGNVYEWCADWYGDYPTGAVKDPVGPDSGERRVVRGGSWVIGAGVCRSAYRGRGTPSNRGYDAGFRLVRSYP